MTARYSLKAKDASKKHVNANKAYFYNFVMGHDQAVYDKIADDPVVWPD